MAGKKTKYCHNGFKITCIPSTTTTTTERCTNTSYLKNVGCSYVCYVTPLRRTCILTLSKQYIISTTTHAVHKIRSRVLHISRMCIIYYHNSRPCENFVRRGVRSTVFSLRNERRKTNDILLLIILRVHPPPPPSGTVLVQLVPRVADIADIVLPNGTGCIRDRPPKFPCRAATPQKPLLLNGQRALIRKTIILSRE